jgi:hypothetical protein
MKTDLLLGSRGSPYLRVFEAILHKTLQLIRA